MLRLLNDVGTAGSLQCFPEVSHQVRVSLSKARAAVSHFGASLTGRADMDQVRLLRHSTFQEFQAIHADKSSRSRPHIAGLVHNVHTPDFMTSSHITPGSTAGTAAYVDNQLLA